MSRGETPRGTERILLVEDDGGIRRALSSVLANHGYDVLATDSAAAALATWEAANGRIDLVVTDLMMPGMSGRELAAALAEKQPDTAILIMSGHRRELDDNLTADYQLLHKPFDGDSLLTAVRACLDRRAQPS